MFLGFEMQKKPIYIYAELQINLKSNFKNF